MLMQDFWQKALKTACLDRRDGKTGAKASLKCCRRCWSRRRAAAGSLIGARNWLQGREKVISRPKHANSAAVRNNWREVNSRKDQRDRGDGPGDLLQ